MNENNEIFFEDKFGQYFWAQFDGSNDTIYIGSGGYEDGYIETNEQLEQVIEFLSKYKGKLK